MEAGVATKSCWTTILFQHAGKPHPGVVHLRGNHQITVLGPEHPIQS